MVLLEFNGVVREVPNRFLLSIPKKFATRNGIVKGTLVNKIVLGDKEFIVSRKAWFVGEVLVITIPTYLVNNGYVPVGSFVDFIDVTP